MRIGAVLCIGAALLLCQSMFGAVAFGQVTGYRSPSQIKAELETIAKSNADVATLRILGQTPGGRDVLLLELGRKDSKAPAILVVANAEGNYPPASEAALRLAGLLIGDWKNDLDSHRWFIIPIGNPDGFARFFDKPLFANYVNGRPVNDDNDDATDEDGPDDLNGDGYITFMRQPHPEGIWLPIEGNPVLMKRAEAAKGEKGIYRLIREGIDNDGDGEINEDGPGGVIPGHNFPHNFQHYTATDGLVPAGEPESRAILEFAFGHPDIAMFLTFGRCNTLKSVPEGSKKADATQDKYKIPEHIAGEMGMDPEQEFTLAELVEMGKEATGYQDLTEEMVLQFLGVGAAVNPDREDLTYWNEISKRYNEFIKEVKLDGPRLKPPEFPPGSIEEWGYYQYGVPTFAMDFWTLPEPKKEEPKKAEGALTPDDIEKMSNEEFIALGKEKIDAFLKANEVPAQYTADMVMMALQGGMMDTKKMAEMMRQSKKKEEAGGADETEQALYTYNPAAFVAWSPYTHPTLGQVDIGGMIPYSTVAPHIDSAGEFINRQLPFVRKLAELVPRVAIDKVKVEKKAAGVWRIDAWVVNTGFLPYPTHQGRRCQRPTPASITITGKPGDILEGRQRVVLGLLEGSGGTQKAGWLIKADEGQTVTLTVQSLSAGTDEKTVTLKGGGQ